MELTKFVLPGGSAPRAPPPPPPPHPPRYAILDINCIGPRRKIGMFINFKGLVY